MPRVDVYEGAVRLYRTMGGKGTPVGRTVGKNVPRGTVAEQVGTYEAGRGAARIRRAEQFEREMVRLGANDFEADHVRIRARNFIESVLSHGGTDDDQLTDDDLDHELELYLLNSLRPWVIDQMKKRGVEPNDGQLGDGRNRRR